MNNNENRFGIMVLDDADLNLVGDRIVGGSSFAEGVALTSGALSLVATIVGFCYWLMNPTNRKNCWTIMMSNISQETAGAIAQQASVLSTTAVSARDNLADVADVLRQSGATVFEDALDVIDDPNEL